MEPKKTMEVPGNMITKKTIYRLFVAMLLVLAGGLAHCLQLQAIPQQSHALMLTKNDISKEYPADVFKAAILKKVLSVDLHNVTLEQGLKAIAQKAGLKLVYAKNIIPAKKRISLRDKEILLEDALWALLADTHLRFGVSSRNHLVIMKSSKEDDNIVQQVQAEMISGTVSDAQTGETLPGVNILVRGTTTGTSTDQSGNYELEVPSLQDTLVITYIGYQRQEVPINGRAQIDIAMQQQAITGNEVVVTAFGVERDRESVGYSVSEVEGESLTRARSSNIADNLSGRVAGVNATQMGGGMAGNSSRILIRGTGSAQGNNQPLYVVNGMPISNNIRLRSAFGGGTVTDKGDGIQHLNPDDIESINVLKGGAAAALYGSNAANGVILITTKDGSQANDGTIGVEFNSNFTVGTINRYPNLQTQYGQGLSGTKPETQQDAFSSGRLSFGDKIEDVEGEPTMNFDGVKRPYVLHPIKDQMQEFYRPSTESSNTLAFNGGIGGEVAYRLSLSNLDAKHIQPNSNYNRKSANLNLNASPGEKLSVSGTVQYTYDKGNNRPASNYAPDNTNWGVTMLARTVPIKALAPGYYPDTKKEKEWQHVAIATNPYFVANRLGNTDSRNRIMSQASVTYNPASNFYIKGDIMRDFEVFESEYYEPIGTAATPNGQFRAENNEFSKLNFRTTMGYDNSYKDFNFSTMLGGNMERISSSTNINSGIDFIVPEFYSFTNLGSTNTNIGVTKQGTNSLFASVDLDYKEMAYLSFTGRQDWFSTLNVNDNSIFYPSIGGSLVLSDIWDLPESISFARLRASWARIGSATVSPYAINDSYSFLTGGHLGVPVLTTSTAQNNANLRPLTSTTREVGVDLDFYNGRFGIDLTFYERKNKDDIISISLPRSSGATSTTINAGEINNRGVELLLSAEPVRNSDLSWNVSYNLGYNRNRVIALAPGAPEGGTSLIGHPVSMFFRRDMAYTEDGTHIYNSVSRYELRTDPLPQGPGVPPWTMGLTNNFSYKNISLDILLDGKFGNYFFSQQARYFHRFGHVKETLPGRENGLNLTGVDENGDPFEQFWPADFMDTYYNNQGNYNAMFVQDGSFVKLRSISLSYVLPLENIGLGNYLKSAEISLVGRNLAILYSQTEGLFDPEQQYDPNDNDQSYVGTQLPRTRNIGINVNLKF